VSKSRVGLGVAGAIVPVVCLVLVIRSCSKTAVSGELAVLGEGGWRAPLNLCRSGELQSFEGVDLGREDTGRMSVRAILDPDRGTIVELTRPGGGVPVRLTADSCPGLVLELRKSGSDGDGAALLDGRVVARCPLPGGQTVQLDAWWKRCGPN
jgi:hypothetical protein